MKLRVVEPLPRLAAANVHDMVGALAMWAAAQPHAAALIHKSDAGDRILSYAALYDRARRAAGGLSRRFAPGQRVVLSFPAGAEFVVALFACLIAKVVAAPAPPPRRGRGEARLQAIAADCGAAAILSLERLVAEFDAIGAPVHALEALEAEGPSVAPEETRPADVAFLQYTSGSTAAPKGVIVTHGAIWANQATIRTAFAHAEGVALVGWLRNHHDLGLIGNLLQPLYCGGRSVILAPQAFLQRPLSWLQAIADHRAFTSGGPNFAYDLCVRAARDDEVLSALDLTSWRVAFNGAEPIRPETLRAFAARFARSGFDAKAFCACYGLAEATLMVTSSRPGGGIKTVRASRAALSRNHLAPAAPDEPFAEVVACGDPVAPVAVSIVDPESGRRKTDGEVGEIVALGPSVCTGYWGRESEQAFDRPGGVRTGDLGAIWNGDLYILGRLKDVIIQNGVKIHPADIEAAAFRADAAIVGAVAFGVASAHPREAIVLVLEMGRNAVRSGVDKQWVGRVRAAIARDTDIAVTAVTVVAPGGLPKTSSGKVQRRRCKTMWVAGEVRGVLFEDDGCTLLRHDPTNPVATAPQRPPPCRHGID